MPGSTPHNTKDKNKSCSLTEKEGQTKYVMSTIKNKINEEATLAVAQFRHFNKEPGWI